MVKDFWKIQIFQIVVRFPLTDFPQIHWNNVVPICTKGPPTSFAWANYFPRGEELNNGVNRVEG